MTVLTPSWSAGNDSSTVENSLSHTGTSNTTDDQNNDTSTTETSSDIFPDRPDPLDRNRRIDAYVDFSDSF
jgi:hypothetical protein